MYKRTLFLICMMSFIVFSVAQGAIIPVGSGTDNSIPDAIATANAGDIIELTDTGPYLFIDQPEVAMDLTIRPQAGLAGKPVLKYAGTSTSAKFFEILENARLELNDLEFAGDGTDVGAAGKAKYVVTIENGDPLKTAGLHVNGIVAHDFNDKFIKPYGNAGMDSLIVTNSIFYSGASEGIVLYSGTSSDPAAVIGYAEITNSTFAAIEREAIKGQTNPTTKVLVDRCTFYDLGAVDKKAMIYFRDMTDVVVKNSIFSLNNNPDLEKFADFDSSLSLFHHNVVWDVTNYEVGTATVSDTLHMDPGFADPVNLDFTLPAGSPLLSYADDGGAVGDPRWVPEPVVHEVYSGTNTISDAYALAAPGDIIELVETGDYLTDVQLEVEKNITIRGRAGLPSKPVLKYVGTSTSAKFYELLGNARLVLENLEFAGDGTADGGAAKAKYVVTIENADPTMKAELIVKDIVAHDFNDKFIKPYANAGMDSLVVTNSIFYNGASEGIVLYSGTSSDPAAVIGYAKVTNSTFYNIEREAIKGQTNPTTKVLVDRCTFYDLGAVDKKAMIYFRDMTDVEVKNSIFAVNNNPDLEKFADFADATSFFHHNVVWDVVNAEVGGATVSDTIHMDPGFADPANADFTLPSGSPLLTFGDDGGPVGDPRWAPLEGKVILSVYVVGKGSVTLDPPGGLYDEGTQVTITAVPDDMYQFDHWSPNVLVFPPNNPTAVLTLNESMEVTAYFVPSIQQYTVTYDAVGLGHVEEELISDFDVDGYWEGDTLILTAVPDTSTWAFVHWTDAEGNEVSTDNPMTYPVEADAHFTAVFNSTLPQVALNVDVVGLGDVNVSPKPVPGFDTYDQGQVVTLEADAKLGWEFTGWSGDITSTDAVMDVTLDTDKSLTATFNELAVPDGKLLVDASWDLRDALGFAKYNSNVEMIVLTEMGPYMPSEEDRNEGKMPQLDIDFPVTIVGDEALSGKPVIKAWGEGGSEGLFRLRTDGHLVLKNLEVDGTLPDDADKKTKYIFRFDDGDSINVSVKADNVDMHGTLEAFLKFYALVHADTLSFTNCTVWDIGKEGIFDNAAGTSDYIEIKNSTFFDVGREILRLKMQTPLVVIDHVTVDSCGFGYGTEGDKFAAFKVENPNKTVITNSIISNVPNTIYGYSIRFYSDESIIDNTLMYNTAEIDNNDGSVVGPDVFWYDPMFAYATSHDFTLQDNSVAYHLANDGSAAIGDLRWATSTNITDYKALNLTVGKNGSVDVSPEPMAKFYTPGTVVTLTAEADTLYKFAGWSGDLVSSNAVETLTMDADKSVTATFEKAYYEITLNVNMSVWADAGKFTVGSDSVDVAGNFNNWGEIPIWMDDEDGDTVYTAVVKIDENHPDMEWKFRINGSWDDATAEFPFGGPPRTYTATGDESLTFWYNDDVAPEGITDVLPLEYELNQNYPNPFNPTTTIRFGLPEAGHAKIVLYDLRGQEVMTLVDTNLPAGYHDVNLNASHLASGVYFYRIKAGHFSSVRKLMLLK